MPKPLPERVAKGTKIVFIAPDDKYNIPIGATGIYDDNFDRSSIPYVRTPAGTRIIARRSKLGLPDSGLPQVGEWIEVCCDDYGANPGGLRHRPRGTKLQVVRVDADRSTALDGDQEYSAVLDGEDKRWKRCDAPAPQTQTQKEPPTMNYTGPIIIETKTFANGSDLAAMPLVDIARTIKFHKADIAELAELNAEPVAKITAEIAAREAGLKAFIAAVNALPVPAK